MIAFARASYGPCQQDHVYAYHGDTLYLMTPDGHHVTPLVNALGDQPTWWPTLVLQIGWKYSVTQAGAPLGVRTGPYGLADSITDLPAGSVFTVLNGPVAAGSASWWFIRTADGTEGWSENTAGWYMFSGGPQTQP